MAAADVRRPYQKFAWFTLAYCVGVILWGAYVRATGSGAGCGQHWPLCDGEVVPREVSSQKLIEFTHRITSGLSLIFVLALWQWTRRLFPRGSFQRRAAGLSAIAIVVEALLGAALVLLRLVEHDQSVDRAVSIALHLVNTLFLLGVLTVTALAAGHENPRWRWREAEGRAWARGLLIGFGVLGALGALTALGDTLFPVNRAVVGEGKRHFLENIRIVHPIFAVLWVGALVTWLARVAERWPTARRLAFWVGGLAVGNLALGLLNVILKAPVWLQLVHLLWADLLWILFVSFLFSAASEWHSAAEFDIHKGS